MTMGDRPGQPDVLGDEHHRAPHGGLHRPVALHVCGPPRKNIAPGTCTGR